MAYLQPSHEQLQRFSDDDHRGPVVMLNLLRFKDGATGQASYQRYTEQVVPMIEACGGKIVSRSINRLTLIGPDAWDETILVTYPSKEALLEMLASPAYGEISHLRSDALADSRLYMMTEPSSV
jgi:uncharacterized protein (DUF1330 family)